MIKNSYTNTVDLFDAIDSLIIYPLTKVWDWDIIDFPNIITPPYPVANGWFLSDGSLLLEIAVSGFTKEELKIHRNDYNLIITGEPEKVDTSDRKRLFQSLSKRKFELKYKIPDKMNLDDISVEMDKGILSITVPIREEMKPIKKQITIR